MSELTKEDQEALHELADFVKEQIHDGADTTGWMGTAHRALVRMLDEFAPKRRPHTARPPSRR